MKIFIHFWLNYSDKNNCVERILVALKNIDHLFCRASEILESEERHLFLLSDNTQIDDNKQLENLENATEFVFFMGKQIHKLLVYVGIKRYLHFKNITYPLSIY